MKKHILENKHSAKLKRQLRNCYAIAGTVCFLQKWTSMNYNEIDLKKLRTARGLRVNMLKAPVSY